MIERTLVLLKPDAIERGIMGNIISRFERVGLKMVGAKMVWIDQELSRKHYDAHVDKPFYTGLEKFMTAGPVLAMVWEGIHAVELVRKIVGDTEPKKAAPGTIRGDFSHHSYAYSDEKGIAIKNLIHASDEAGAKKEVALWFTDEEMHSYSTVHEKHTR